MRFIHFRQTHKLVLLFLFASFSAAADGYLEKLTLADEAKRVNLEQFNQILVELAAEKEQFSRYELAYLHYLNGYKLAYSGKLKESIELYKQALDESDDKVLSYRIVLSIANVFWLSRNYSETLQYLDQVLQLSPEINDKQLRHRGYLLASGIYNRLFNEFELGKNFSELVLSDEPTPQNRCIASESNFRALIALESIQPDDPEVQRAISYCQSVGENIFGYLIMIDALGKRLTKDNASEITGILESNQEGILATNYANLASMYYVLTSQAYWNAEEFDTSREYAEKTLEITSDRGNPEHLLTALYLLHEYHDQSGQYEEALVFHKRYADVDSQYKADLLDRNMAFVINGHSNIERNQRIELLNKQNELLKIEQLLTEETAEKNRLLISILGITLALIFWWGWKTTIKAKGFKTLAQYDQLTQIFSRGHFQEIMTSVIKASKQKDKHLGFAIFDLDHFKRVNDQYGHPVGDWVLKKVISVCKSLPCRSCTLGRLGGEEFALVIENATLEELVSHCEQCRQLISEIDTKETQYDFTITASFGLSTSELSGYDYKLLLTNADEALYKAKNAGRNRIETFEPIKVNGKTA
ncbi:diguanylate cyclase [Marinicella sp. W31]|uniref:diguanylate cyclase n=1 Tax=Marinicella sp. W31 TaxID=3023713 RepID=UPI003757C135